MVVVSGGKEKEEAANPTQTAASADSVEQFDKKEEEAELINPQQLINPPETTNIDLVKDKAANGNSQVDIVCTEVASTKEKSENSEKETHKSKMENKDMSVGKRLAPGLASILKKFLQKKVNNKKWRFLRTKGSQRNAFPRTQSYFGEKFLASFMHNFLSFSSEKNASAISGKKITHEENFTSSFTLVSFGQ